MDFGPEIIKADGTVIHIEKGRYPVLNQFPQYSSAGGEVGLQLPGPDALPGGSDGQSERGFDVDGVDPAGSYVTNIVGVQLPGNSSQEPGLNFGEDFRNLASHQDVPVGLRMGEESDQGSSIESHGGGEGFRVFGSGTDASDILPVFEAIADAGGHSPMGGVPGMDSLKGIPLGAGSGIVGGPGYSGEALDEADGQNQGSMYGSGDNGGNQDDFSRYPSGSPLRPS